MTQTGTVSRINIKKIAQARFPLDGFPACIQRKYCKRAQIRSAEFSGFIFYSTITSVSKVSACQLNLTQNAGYDSAHVFRRDFLRFLTILFSQSIRKKWLGKLVFYTCINTFWIISQISKVVCVGNVCLRRDKCWTCSSGDVASSYMNFWAQSKVLIEYQFTVK